MIIVAAVFFAASSNRAIATSSSPTSQNLSVQTQNSFGTRVTNRKPNTKGRVLVLMYHHIREGKNPMFRSASKFRRDLENLYNNGFRPVTMTEFVENRMPLPPGASPVILTFDDAWGNQFWIERDGSVRKSCAVGIWMDFAQKRPDFPVKGVWYVLPQMWEQSKHIQTKVDMLLKMGSELGNHTMNHRQLGHIRNPETIKAEIAGMSDLLAKYGVTGPIHFAPPYGEYPRSKQLVKEFTYKGKIYKLGSSVLAGSCPTVAPNSKKFDPYVIARVHGNGRQYGIDDWLNQMKLGQWKPYVAP